MKLVGIVGAAGLSLAVALPALAQTTAPASGAPQAAQQGTRQAEARVDARIATLHDELHITAAEEQDWQAFTAVMKQNAAAQDAALEAREKDFAGMDAVQDLQSYAQLQQQQAQQIASLVGPFQALYAQLSPEQKSTADRIFHNYTARAARRRG